MSKQFMIISKFSFLKSSQSINFAPPLCHTRDTQIPKANSPRYSINILLPSTKPQQYHKRTNWQLSYLPIIPRRKTKHKNDAITTIR